MKIALLFPNQLFENHEIINEVDQVYLIEEYLFFKQYRFHKQKILFHRASMQFYKNYLEAKNIKVNYIESISEASDILLFFDVLKFDENVIVHFIDPVDNWLEKRIINGIKKHKLEVVKYNNPLFLNQQEEMVSFFKDKKRMFQTDFYIFQRKKWDILLDSNKKPIGDKWTFDADNRKKYPKGKTPPKVMQQDLSIFHKEALNYVASHFHDNYGQLDASLVYPIDFESSKIWFEDFLKNRFAEFGIYEDAIQSDALILNHSLITPMLNVGLLTPTYIIDRTLEFILENEIPLNSSEGFIRQVIGWREFIRGVYILKGTEERTKNFWNFKRKIPESFWKGTTGILPFDDVIQKVLKTGYCHHIERLMVLGNFMLLCEFDPDEVYRWFMELFIDAYDWVMVPNVYGMSQFADGGLMATKPYISGSNYILKMSNYSKGSWQEVWDGLFWRFMDTHRDFFLKNPRLSMLVHSFDKMDIAKKEHHLKNSNQYLSELDALLI